jgi:transcription initiation factor TFIIF subunit beta
VPFDENLVTHMLFEAFKLHKIWGFRELRARTQQPHDYLKKVLSKIAFKHDNGDWAHKWELKDDYKDTSDLRNAKGAAPRAEGEPDTDDSDPDEDDGDEDDEDLGADFEDVKMQT